MQSWSQNEFGGIFVICGMRGVACGVQGVDCDVRDMTCRIRGKVTGTKTAENKKRHFEFIRCYIYDHILWSRYPYLTDKLTG